MRQRGSILVMLLVGIAFLGALGVLYGTVHGDGVEQGEGNINKLWDAQKEKDREIAASRRATATATAAKSTKDLAAAHQKGAEYAENWKRARAAATKPLATCPEPSRSVASRQDDPTPAPTGLRFSWRFVSLYDRIWTGDAGQPLLSDPASKPGLDADTPSPIGPGEVLDNHAANAQACSVDRRALNSLIDQIEKLRAGWK